MALPMATGVQPLWLPGAPPQPVVAMLMPLSAVALSAVAAVAVLPCGRRAYPAGGKKILPPRVLVRCLAVTDLV
jgi:hypothetical protein